MGPIITLSMTGTEDFTEQGTLSIIRFISGSYADVENRSVFNPVTEACYAICKKHNNLWDFKHRCDITPENAMDYCYYQWNPGLN